MCIENLQKLINYRIPIHLCDLNLQMFTVWRKFAKYEYILDILSISLQIFYTRCHADTFSVLSSQCFVVMQV